MYERDTRIWRTISFNPDGVQGPGARSVAALLTFRKAAWEYALVTMFGQVDPSFLGHAGAGKTFDDVWVYNIRDSSWSKVGFGDGDTRVATG